MEIGLTPSRFALTAGATRAGFLRLAVALLAVLVCLRAGAVAVRLPNQDPEAIARGNAFVATADNPAAIYYNPAGITQLEGQNISGGLYFISASTKFDGANGSHGQTSASFQTVPQVYYVYAPTNFPLSFGVGVYAPYGLALDWGDNNPFRTVAQNGSLLYATVNPVVAWKALDQLSVAVGPTINYAKVNLNQGIGFVPNDQFHFVGDDFDFGFTAGVLWKPHQMVALGLNYHSATKMNFGGHASTVFPPGPSSSAPSTASLQFPQNVVGGISFRPTENWNLEFDLDWTDWHAVKQASFTTGTPFGNFDLPLNYKSGFMYEFGVTRQLCHGYFASAGYIYSENSSPDAYFNPIIPDANLHLGSIGFGHHGEHWNWAASYTLAINPSHQINNSVFGPSVSGTYRTLNNAINISAGFKF